MQLKNAGAGNIQLFFYSRKDNVKEEVLDFVHIPGGATVAIEDSIFEACRKSTTSINEVKEVVTELVEDNIGAVVQTDKKPLVIKEYFETGRVLKVSLVDHLIKQGTLQIVERVAVSLDEMDKFLNSQGISVKDLSEEQRISLYDKLA